MFKHRILTIVKSVFRLHRRTDYDKVRAIMPVTFGLIGALCQNNPDEFHPESLEHEFLIRQATTVSVNAATQLLTVTMVAIQDTSERLRDALSKEICLVRQAVEWGVENTPEEHWDDLVAVRGALCDLNYNIRTLYSYMEYAEKLATTAAEISYLSGNIAASDAICSRIEHITRTCNTQKQLTHNLQQESLELQQKAIIASPQIEDKLQTEEHDIKNIPKAPSVA